MSTSDPDRGVSAMLTYFGGSFFLHLLWENLQAPLYAGYISFSQHFLMCFKATATGDMLFMLLIYLVLATVHQDLFWADKRQVYEHPVTWTLTAIIGGLQGISCEYWALTSHRWQYDAMPLLPILHVGIFPVLQMIFVPTLTLLICSQFVSQS